MGRWVLLAGAIVAETSATLALRAATDTPAWYALVVAGYAAAVALLAGVLRTGMAISVAYGIWAAVGVATTALLAAVPSDEPLTWVMGLHFLAVIAGVLLVELGSHRAEHTHAVPREACWASPPSPEPSRARSPRPWPCAPPTACATSTGSPRSSAAA